MIRAASANTTSPVRAAIYLRISQDRELDGLAIERQREDSENLAKFRRWEVVETYVDQSKGATDKTKKRPAYDQMVADHHAGCFTAIVCYDLDRLTRQPRQLEDWITGLRSVACNWSPPTATPTCPPTVGGCMRASRRLLLAPRWSARAIVSPAPTSSVPSRGGHPRACAPSGMPSTARSSAARRQP